jgi:hypothetical protein
MDINITITSITATPINAEMPLTIPKTRIETTLNKYKMATGVIV